MSLIAVASKNTLRWNRFPLVLWEIVGGFLSNPLDAIALKKTAKFGKVAFERFCLVYLKQPIFEVYREEVDTLLKNPSHATRLKEVARRVIEDGMDNRSGRLCKAEFPDPLARLCDVPAYTEKCHKIFHQGAIKGFSIKNLQEYRCSNNGFTRIPSQLFCAVKLTVLDLEGNELSWLPRAVYSLSSLVELNVSSNRIKFLSPEISRLTSLQILNVSRNQLTSLPAELSKMKLQELDISGNSIVDIPQELSSSENAAIISALDILQSEKNKDQKKDNPNDCCVIS